MASYCTDENKRLRYARRCFDDLLRTVDFNRHSLGIYLNSPCDEAIEYFNDFEERFLELFPKENLSIFANEENVGTAKAVNHFLKIAADEGIFGIKADDDIIVNKVGWVDEMEEVLTRMPEIFILGLKRRDLMESTYRNDVWKSELLEVPHKHGERWYVVEKVAHVMGTCVMLSPECLERVGALYQMGGVYAYDDSLHALRSAILGKLNCFLHGIDIDHIDEGGDWFTEWKRKYAGDNMELYNKTVAEFKAGILPIYQPFE